MRFDWVTFALQTVNFAILVWLLQRFLYRPLLNLLDARKAEVQKQYDEAGETRRQALALLDETRAERASIASEREQALRTAAAQAEELVASRREKAGQEAVATLRDARETLAAEREQALAEARRAAIDLGADIARRLLEETPVSLRVEAWLERIERYLASLPREKLDGLMGQLSNGAQLRIITAAPLPPDVAEDWRARLRWSTGDHVAIAFTSDPDLIAGAELHFPTAILNFSWRGELAALKAEFESSRRSGERDNANAHR